MKYPHAHFVRRPPEGAVGAFRAAGGALTGQDRPC